jgi:hypothetical protein
MSSLILLLFLTTTMVYGRGKSEAQVRRELQKQNISAIPINKNLIADYIFIDNDLVILSYDHPKIVEYNISTGEQKTIAIPMPGRKMESFRYLSHDKTMNTIHMIVQEQNEKGKYTFSYYALHLNDYTWEAFPEFGDRISRYYYDSVKKRVYVNYFRDREIVGFDIESREIVERINLPEGMNIIHNMYGAPLQIVASVYNENEIYHFYYYNTETGFEYLKSIAQSEIYSFDDYIHIEGWQFLCINIRHQYKREFVTLDLSENIENIVILKSFPFEIYHLKRYGEGAYSFIAYTDDKWSLLCFMEYP